MISFVSTMLAINLAPVLFYMGKQMKLLAIKYFRNVSRWFKKTFLADSFKNTTSSLDIIKNEKEKII